MIINLYFWRGLIIFPKQRYMRKMWKSHEKFDLIYIGRGAELVLPAGAKIVVGKKVIFQS